MSGSEIAALNATYTSTARQRCCILACVNMMRLLAGQQAVKQGQLGAAISHLRQAGPWGWVPLTAAYLHTKQLQPALLLLQQAVAQAYASQTCTAQAHSPAIQTCSSASQAHSPATQAHSSATDAHSSDMQAHSPAAQAHSNIQAIEWVAAQQLAQQWLGLIVSVIEEHDKQDELTLLLFPAAHTPQLGVPEVTCLPACFPAVLCLARIQISLAQSP